ncbi:MAG: hypothetical protein KDI69_02945 [Xanthomonadales bacterium]|nr:hypothetical protein [Xanthomonadales bacterium]
MTLPQNEDGKPMNATVYPGVWQVKKNLNRSNQGVAIARFDAVFNT